MTGLLGYTHLPEASNEFIIADVAIAVDIVVAHERLQLNFLREDSMGERKVGKNYKIQVSIQNYLKRVFAANGP